MFFPTLHLPFLRIKAWWHHNVLTSIKRSGKQSAGDALCAQALCRCKTQEDQGGTSAIDHAVAQGETLVEPRGVCASATGSEQQPKGKPPADKTCSTNIVPELMAEFFRFFLALC
jgi:hypothetical protein